jgi:hypothetical protein
MVLGFRVKDFRFRIWDSWFRVYDFELSVLVLGPGDLEGAVSPRVFKVHCHQSTHMCMYR